MKKIDRYTFPAVFTYEKGHEIAVTFPDIPGCATSGKDDIDALDMAKTTLRGFLWCLENDGEKIPRSSKLCDIPLEANEHAVLIDAYMPVIRLTQENKVINNTVTLPVWLNTLALEKEIDLSQVLQKTLINDFGLNLQ